MKIEDMHRALDEVRRRTLEYPERLLLAPVSFQAYVDCLTTWPRYVLADPVVIAPVDVRFCGIPVVVDPHADEGVLYAEFTAKLGA